MESREINASVDIKISSLALVVCSQNEFKKTLKMSRILAHTAVWPGETYWVGLLFIHGCLPFPYVGEIVPLTLLFRSIWDFPR